MNLARDYVAASEPTGDKQSRPQWRRDQHEDEHDQEESGQPMHVSVDQLFSENGTIKVNGTLVLEGLMQPPSRHIFNLISTETHFYFHTFEEMQAKVRPSNENTPPSMEREFRKVIKSYKYPTLAVENSHRQRPPTI